jgi:small nuclear ribonucleoprotein (snRNP)-like protein
LLQKKYSEEVVMKKGILAGVLVALCCSVAVPSIVSAAEAWYEMKMEATIRSILIEKINKKVIVRLENGETLEGFVSKVGDTMVHLTTITGKEYFDGVVRIDKISAVVFRVKEK